MKNELDPKAIVVALVIGLFVVLAIGLFFSGMLKSQLGREYGYIGYDGQYGVAKDCHEWYGSLQCKEDGHTYTLNAQEYWLLVEGR